MLSVFVNELSTFYGTVTVQPNFSITVYGDDQIQTEMQKP